MALIIFSGWEWGFIDNTIANNNEGTHDSSPTIVSGAWAGSTFSLRCNPAGAAVADYNFSGLGPLGNLVATSVPTSYFRMDWKWDTKPGANREPIFRFDNVSAAHAKFTLALNSSAQLVALDRNGTLMATGTTAIPQSTKTTLYVSVGTGANAPWEVRLNSSTATPEISGTGNLDTVNGGEIRIGKATNLFSQSVDFSYDNFAWRDDFYPPPGICIMLVPVADGFYQNGTANGAATRWQCVNQIPSSVGGTFINGLSAGQAYTAKVAPMPSGIVNYVASFVAMKRESTAMLASVRLRSGSVDSDTTPADAANYNVRRKLFETDPATGLAWTPSAVGNAQVGVLQTDANAVRLTSAYILVDYQPAVAVTATPIGGAYSPSAPFQDVLNSSPVPSY